MRVFAGLLIAMKLLFAIPHYYANAPGKRYGSLSAGRGSRVHALTRTISAIRVLYGSNQHLASPSHVEWVPANRFNAESIEILVCTQGGRHVLADVPLPKDWYKEIICDCDPFLLGFECHAQLREGLGRYDYFCYLEDDLILHDPWLFIKLRRFVEVAGMGALLQPNRFELPQDAQARKVYIDGNLPGALTARFQNLHDRPQVELDCLGISVPCRRTRNPHSGCFFLSAEQMDRWARQPYFLDRDTSFVGPLESAVTLGIMRAFRVYKPAPEVGSFLEVEHFGEAWTRRIEKLTDRARLGRSERALADALTTTSVVVSPSSQTPQAVSPTPPTTATRNSRPGT